MDEREAPEAESEPSAEVNAMPDVEGGTTSEKDGMLVREVVDIAFKPLLMVLAMPELPEMSLPSGALPVPELPAILERPVMLDTAGLEALDATLVAELEMLEFPLGEAFREVEAISLVCAENVIRFESDSVADSVDRLDKLAAEAVFSMLLIALV